MNTSNEICVAIRALVLAYNNLPEWMTYTQAADRKDNIFEALKAICPTMTVGELQADAQEGDADVDWKASAHSIVKAHNFREPNPNASGMPKKGECYGCGDIAPLTMFQCQHCHDKQFEVTTN